MRSYESAEYFRTCRVERKKTLVPLKENGEKRERYTDDDCITRSSSFVDAQVLSTDFCYNELVQLLLLLTYDVVTSRLGSLVGMSTILKRQQGGLITTPVSVRTTVLAERSLKGVVNNFGRTPASWKEHLFEFHGVVTFFAASFAAKPKHRGTRISLCRCCAKQGVSWLYGNATSYRAPHSVVGICCMFRVGDRSSFQCQAQASEIRHLHVHSMYAKVLKVQYMLGQAEERSRKPCFRVNQHTVARRSAT